MYLIKHVVFNDYKAINKADLWKMKAFKNFEIIKDEKEIGEILRTHFNSASRGGEYNPNLPSCTQITSQLFPIDFAKEYGLIKWMNDKTPKAHKDAKKSSITACDKGTALHKVLEDCLIERVTLTDEPFTEFTNDEEILTTLENFKNEQAGKIKKFKTELFLQTSYCQGSVDLLAEYEGRLTLCDYKTTSRVDKKTGKPIFYTPSKLSPYKRQLCLYTIMLEDTGVLTRKEITNLDYRIFQFHFVKKDYKMFDVDREEIFALEPEIIKVLDWYMKMIKK